MKNLFIALAEAMILSLSTFAQPPDTLWTRTYGGTNADATESVQQTTDGGYIVAGMTTSYGAGGFDFCLVKTDSSGNSLWLRTYGGSGEDWAKEVRQTTDGGYIAVGHTNSFGAGAMDFYLVKTNSSGDTLWTRTYGGSGYDRGSSVKQTADGGYIVAGYTMSYGAGGNDVYLIKTNSTGDTLWTRIYGGSNFDGCFSVQQTVDGGYFLAGYTYSFGGGGSDLYLVKTNSTGDTLWTATLGGLGNEDAMSVQQTLDGGYIAAGSTNSFGAGGYDFYLVKTNSSGDTLWTRTYGGVASDYAYAVQQTRDGGYIAAGSTNSFGAGGYDYYLIRLAGPTLIVTLTPHNPPIQINPGGFFWYRGEVDNHTTNPMTFDLWSEAILPNGVHYGPLLLYNNLTLGSMGHIERAVRVRVPQFAPPGNYQYYAAVGTYPSAVIDEDAFPFTILTGDPVSSNNQWLVEPFEGVTPVPADYSLGNASPNPCNPAATISFTLPEDARIKLVIYDVNGREAATLVDGLLPAGLHEVEFNASGLASGIYFYRLSAPGFTSVKKMALVK